MPEQIDSRRSFLKSSLAAAVAAAVPAAAEADNKSAAKATRPNIILYLSDQFRWDFIGANGHNSSTRTPDRRSRRLFG